MDQGEFLRLVQRRVANVAISPTTLRNQGAGGVNEAARRFLAGLDLGVLRGIAPADYPKTLDDWTSALIERLPAGAQRWGTARKALNVFMEEVFFSRFLAQAYNLERFRDALETPLDTEAALKMKRLAGRGQLPKWPRIVGLTPEVSAEFQSFASSLAAKRSLPRAALDLILWRAEASA